MVATVSGEKHPAEAFSVIYLDVPACFRENQRSLTCFGAFEVNIIDGEPVFRSHHLSASDQAKRLTLINELGTLSHDRHVLVGSAYPSETFWDFRHVLQAGLLYIDTIRGLESVLPAKFSLVGAPEQSMIEMASELGLRNCYEIDLLAQARCAHVRAQLVWLTYVTTTASRKAAASLLAAFQAWRAIEMARPIPF